MIAKLESGELNFATSDVLSDFVRSPVLKELVAEFFGWSKEDAEKIVVPLRPMAKSSVRDRVVRKSEAAPLFKNAEQNSNYLRLNAQCELRKCEEFGERPEERFHFSFAASKELKELLDRAQRLRFSGALVIPTWRSATSCHLDGVVVRLSLT